MHLSSKTDIEAPLDFVYAALTDFEGWERAAMRRGADVSRTDKLRVAGPGLSWHIRFRFRGRERALQVKLVGMEPARKLSFEGEGKLISGDMALDLISLAPKRTRLTLHLDIKPKTLGARLFLQSMKLAKGRVQARLNTRLGQLANDIEMRHASSRKV